jgi:hypothetical protein
VPTHPAGRGISNCPHSISNFAANVNQRWVEFSDNQSGISDRRRNEVKTAQSILMDRTSEIATLIYHHGQAKQNKVSDDSFASDELNKYNQMSIFCYSKLCALQKLTVFHCGKTYISCNAL